jgi:hypothetical protein
MSKNESQNKATSKDDARLPATRRENINEPPEVQEDKSDTAKDVNVVRGDDRPQSVRHGG